MDCDLKGLGHVANRNYTPKSNINSQDYNYESQRSASWRRHEDVDFDPSASKPAKV